MDRQKISSRLSPLGLVLFAFLFCGCVSEDLGLPEKSVIQVNDERLSAKEFSDLLAEKLKSFDALSAKDKVVVSRAKEALLRDFIAQSLSLQWAKKNGLFVRAEALDAEINSIRSNYPDDLSFQQALAQEGLRFREWKSRVSATLLQRLVVEKIKSSVKEPTEEELLAYYNSNKNDFQIQEQIKIRQIVLANESDAQSVYDGLKSGKNFTDLAKSFSVAPEASKGGELGWIERGLLDVFDSAFKLPKGQRSSILKSPYGYHIIEVLARRPAQTLPFSEAKALVRRHVIENREQAVYSSWLEDQVRLAKVFRDTALIDSIKVETRGK